MEYIEGYSGADLYKISSYNMARNLKQSLSILLSKNIESSKFKNHSTHDIVFKLREIESIVQNKKIRDMLYNLKLFIENKKNIFIPIGYCHGDLTTSNIIATSSSTFYLIDFLLIFRNSNLGFLKNKARFNDGLEYKISVWIFFKQY